MRLGIIDWSTLRQVEFLATNRNDHLPCLLSLPLSIFYDSSSSSLIPFSQELFLCASCCCCCQRRFPLPLKQSANFSPTINERKGRSTESSFNSMTRFHSFSHRTPFDGPFNWAIYPVIDLAVRDRTAVIPFVLIDFVFSVRAVFANQIWLLQWIFHSVEHVSCSRNQNRLLTNNEIIRG